MQYGRMLGPASISLKQLSKSAVPVLVCAAIPLAAFLLVGTCLLAARHAARHTSYTTWQRSSLLHLSQYAHASMLLRSNNVCCSFRAFSAGPQLTTCSMPAAHQELATGRAAPSPAHVTAHVMPAFKPVRGAQSHAPCVFCVLCVTAHVTCLCVCRHIRWRTGCMHCKLHAPLYTLLSTPLLCAHWAFQHTLHADPQILQPATPHPAALPHAPNRFKPI